MRKERSPVRRRPCFLPRSVRVACAAVVVASLPLLLLPGCGRGGEQTAKPAGPVLPDIAKMAIKPNELGYIPVVMYHEIVPTPPKRDPGKMFRATAAFKKDLERMYAAGFRPVNLSDVVNDAIDIPAGMSPVVLTFDDGRESQFRLTETASALKVDPGCALGVLQAFAKTHPDWRMRGTFFVLPKSETTKDVFGQTGLGPQKLAYLLDQGMEIGNHSVHHKDMSRMNAAQIQAEIGGAQNALMEAAPNAVIQTLALPMGKFPRDPALRKYLLAGTHAGKSYSYKAVMDASYRAVPSPAARLFDPSRLERIGARDDRWGVRWWINELGRSSVYPRYVSDGDPNVVSFPKDLEALANVPALQKQQKVANAYGGAGTSGGGTKPIIGAGDNAAPGAATTVTKKPAASKPIIGG